MSKLLHGLKRTAQVLGLGGVVLLGAGTVWYQQHYVLPPEPKIEVKLPSPNGYDTLWEACNLEVGKKDGTVTSPSNNRDADQLLPGRLALLEANKPSIEQLREALKQDYLIPASQSPDKEFPRWAKAREEARMLAFASRTYADTGNLPEAARCALDTIELGATVPRGGVLITGLVGVACEAIGMKALGDLADKLDAPTARMAARRLAEIDRKRPIFGDILRQENQYSRTITRTMFSHGPLGAWKASESLFSSPEIEQVQMSQDRDSEITLKDRLAQFWFQAQVAYYGPKTALEGNERYMTELVVLSEKPWSHPRATPTVPSDPLSQLLTPVFSQAEFKWVSVRASNALLQTRLALSAYRQEKGSYPESLDALVSEGYLDAVPSDPFSPTRAAPGYKPDGEKFTLWSVGPDAKDDGGKPVEMEGKRGFVDASKPGDFVDGVNTY